MNPVNVFAGNEVFGEKTSTVIRVSSERSLSILMDMDPGKQESFELLDKNSFAVSSGVSRNVYDCLKSKLNDESAIQNQLLANCHKSESDFYADIIQRNLFLGTFES